MRLALAAAVLAAGPALADSAANLGHVSVSDTNGAAIYQHVCQGCHMPGGAGAVGAARYPKLAGDPRLVAARYPVAMVLQGHGAMPWFNGVLTDAQVADVVNYVRTHFGNSYTDGVTAAEVVALKGPAPVMER